MAPPSFFPTMSSPSCSTSTITISPVHSTSRPGKISRSSSSKSDLSCDMRQWRPTEPIALTGVAGRECKGDVLGKVQTGDAERGLSSRVFVENERLAGAKDHSKRKKGWGGALVDGAMNAGVFSAALGLTAYRLWSSDDRGKLVSSETSLSPMTSPSLSSGSSAASSSSRSRPGSVEFSPPPAYFESLRHPVQLVNKDDDPAWIDVDTLFDIPAHKRSTSKTTPPKYIRSKRLSRQRARLSLRSVASITVEDLLPHQQSPCPIRVRPPEETPSLDRSLQLGEVVDVEDEQVESIEILDRLDSISEHLRAMIEEGRKALATPSPVIPVEGWIDEARVQTVDAPCVDRTGSYNRTKIKRRTRGRSGL